MLKIFSSMVLVALFHHHVLVISQWLFVDPNNCPAAFKYIFPKYLNLPKAIFAAATTHTISLVWGGSGINT